MKIEEHGARRQRRIGDGLTKQFSIAAYTQILTGAGTRLVLQAAYFAVLVNALTLADYGVFASVLALSLILSGGGTFGFSASLFRAATTRRRILGAYLAAFLVYALGECVLLILLGLLVYEATFRAYLHIGAFFAVLFSEMVLWRLFDALGVISNGLGRYRNNIVLGGLASGGRLVSILLFVGMGGGNVSRWTGFYVLGNGCATLIGLLLFWPRIPLRWESRILRRRLREAVSFWAINTLQTLQIEADKLIVLSIAGEQQAGIYALSMRIIELLLLPIKSFFPPYMQALLRRRDRFGNWRQSLLIEGGLAVVALGLFGGTVVFLSVFPHLLGPNVARAVLWFRKLPLLPVARALLDYHREVMFAAERLAIYAMVAGLLAATRLATIGAILMMTATIDALIWPINGIALTLYVISASAVWGLVLRPIAQRPWTAPLAKDPA